MKKVLFLFLLGASLVTARAQTAMEQKLVRFDESGPLKGSVWGLCVKDMEGKTLVSHHAQTRMVPASNCKLITTGTALHAFGPEYRFKTGIGYTGSIGPDGTLEGDVYIMGGGDPSLGAADSLVLQPDALFWKWKTLLREAGIQRIHGRIVGDGSAYEGLPEQDSWQYADVGTYYGAGTTALSFYENTIDFEVSASAPGEPVNLRQKYPETPWLQVENCSATAPAGTGNSLFLYTTDYSSVAQLQGTFAIDRKPKVESFANKYGALTCAYYFWKNLRDTGWEVTGGYTDKPGEGKPVQIGYSESPQLKDLVRYTNHRSDNFYAEGFLRAMGEAACGIAVYDSCRVAEKVVLEDLGLSMDGISLVDGSGLSRENYVSPQWMADYLLSIRQSPAFPAFLASIPHPGQGTLSSIALPADRICMKSGSMGGVLCYSGYVLDASGKPCKVFSLLTNNALAPVREVRATLVQIMAMLID